MPHPRSMHKEALHSSSGNHQNHFYKHQRYHQQILSSRIEIIFYPLCIGCRKYNAAKVTKEEIFHYNS
jgi:hypothetical protein